MSEEEDVYRPGDPIPIRPVEPPAPAARELRVPGWVGPVLAGVVALVAGVAWIAHDPPTPTPTTVAVEGATKLPENSASTVTETSVSTATTTALETITQTATKTKIRRVVDVRTQVRLVPTTATVTSVPPAVTLKVTATRTVPGPKVTLPRATRYVTATRTRTARVTVTKRITAR